MRYAVQRGSIPLVVISCLRGKQEEVVRHQIVAGVGSVLLCILLVAIIVGLTETLSTSCVFLMLT